MWSFNVGSPIQAPPVSYSVNGKQYIAVLVGASMSAFIMQNQQFSFWHFEALDGFWTGERADAIAAV
jgi:hypothetical protein